VQPVGMGQLQTSPNEENLKVRFQLIESFERDFLAPGLDQDRLSTVWVHHRNHDRTELHFVIANVDLETWKRFPAYFFRREYLTKSFRKLEGLDIGRSVQLQERSDSADRGVGKAYFQTHVDPQSMDRDSHHFNFGGVPPGYFDDVDMDAKGAMESPHVAATDDGWADLSSDRGPHLEDVQHRQQFKISQFPGHGHNHISKISFMCMEPSSVC
jgi:hypothetical protein